MSILWFAVFGIVVVAWLLFVDNVDVIWEAFGGDADDIPNWLYPQEEEPAKKYKH